MRNEFQLSTVSADIFRAYDIRGIYGESLTADSMYQIGLALGSEARNRGVTQIITARDCRLSGPILLLALQQGLLASGCDVIDIGIVPTPVLYFATHILPTNSGVMLTGSHNPPEHNGLKIVLQGKTLKEQEIKNIHQRISVKDFVYGSGSITTADILADYIHKITSDIKVAKPLKVVIDCGNGVAGNVAPQLIQALGCEVIKLYCDLDGRFPHHEPDPSQPKNLVDLIDAVKIHNADMGLAFDGDGDRLGLVTNQGEIIWPDRQMMLFTKDILANNPQATCIYDVKCSRQLADVIKQYGGTPLMWKTGHSLIKAKMLETGAKFAGEMSGHLFFKDRWYGFDDGMYAAARLLEIVSRDKRDVATIFRNFPNSVNTPELKLPISESEKFAFMDQFIAKAKFPNAETTTIDGIRVDFPFGWGLLRPSNTTSYLIFRFEAIDEQALEVIKKEFREQLLALDETLVLPF
jgi:phosphomannomutase/phosphoglucomutase